MSDTKELKALTKAERVAKHELLLKQAYEHRDVQDKVKLYEDFALWSNIAKNYWTTSKRGEEQIRILKTSQQFFASYVHNFQVPYVNEFIEFAKSLGYTITVDHHGSEAIIKVE